jgi:5'-nucleotidase
MHHPERSIGKILLTNDDGYDAPGLEALERAVAGFGAEVIVAAPAECHSGGGHRVTTHRPVPVRSLAHGRFAIEGTPADCTRLALSRLCPDVGFVLSGINAGGNLGVDVHLSGTVAAAREAALHGRRALAVSQYRGRSAAIDWERASCWVATVLARVAPLALEPGEFWNVNLPDPATVAEGHAGQDPPIIECAVDPSPFALAFDETPAGWLWAANYHERPRRAGHDVAICFGGAIALSRCRVV